MSGGRRRGRGLQRQGAIEHNAPAARVSGGASSCECIQGTGVRLHAGVSGQCPLVGEPQDYRLQQLRYPVRVDAGAAILVVLS